MTATSFRPALALATGVAIAVFLPQMANGQANEGTVTISVADWLEPWDSETGGWIAVSAGATPSVKATLRSALSAEIAPGIYDVYWLQNETMEPLLIEEGVAVEAGEETTIRAVTGVRFEAADWVAPRNPDNGWLGAYRPEAESFDEFANMSVGGDSFFLPPGDYDVFYESDATDAIAPIWLGTASIEQPFAGIGIEVAELDGDMTVVRTLPGGPADNAGLQAEDIIRTVDGEPLTGLELAEAVDLLRGPSESQAILGVDRAGESLDLTVTRARVEPDFLMRAFGGVELSWSGADPIGPSGVWGAVFADEPLSGGYVNFSEGEAGGPLLLGSALYDIYWNPDGDGPDELLAEDVVVDGGIVQVPVGPRK